MVKITGVEQGSLACASGIMAGDVLISVNSNEINDVLDYRFYLTERRVTLLLSRDGEEYVKSIKKGEYDDIGLEFETPLMDEKHSCRNGCIFCFIDQNPAGMRDSIYFKDDDSRLSFIHGNYITLTNMTKKDVERIIKMRISPVNISVHTTNPELRVKMMKNKRAGEVLSYLDDFKNNGISMCGQVVLCRGVNDGAELRRTLSDLSRYFPELGSVSIVPAGLTAHREGLYPLSDFSREEAEDVINTVESFALEHLRTHGSRMFFLADELYLKAGLPIPDADYYEEYPQLDNGVGLLRSLSDEFLCAENDSAELDPPMERERCVTVATGVAAYPTVRSLAELAMRSRPKLRVRVVEVKNDFFGHSVTVSGLLTGRDIASALSGESLGDEVLISSSCLRHGEEVFLCGMTLSELSDILGTPVRAVDSDGFSLFDALMGQ